MDGRQQQDQQPPRRGGRAFPSPQPYQPRRRQDPAAEEGELAQLAREPVTSAAHTARPGGKPSSGGRHGGAGRRAQHRGPPGHAPGGTGYAFQPLQVQQRAAQQAPPAAVPLASAPMHDLAATAGDARLAEAVRAGALQQLHQRLFDPADQRQALQQLETLWPRLLAVLLDDPAPAVTAAAAPVVGAIGALAAQATAAAAAARAASGGATTAASGAAGSSASGLLFDWLLPVLQQRASLAGRTLQQHQLAAVLLALRDCLTGVDAVTLARYANAVLGACQALLEDEATPPALLPPLLAVLQQAARHQHSIKARFQDLVDLLLGWALEPALPDTARPALSRTLAALGAQWRQQPGFTSTLLGSLLADMGRLVAKAGAEAADASADAACDTSSASLRQLLALAACVLPMLDAAAAAQLASCCSHLHRFLVVCRQAVAACTAGAASPAAAVAAVAELAGHVSRLAALAPVAVAAATCGSTAAAQEQEQQQQQQQQQEHQQPPPSGSTESAGAEYVAVQLVASMQALGLTEGYQGTSREHVHLRLAIQPLEAAGDDATTQDTARSLLQLFAAVSAFAAAALTSPSILALTAVTSSTLAALRSWLQVLVQQQPGSLESCLDAAARILLPSSDSDCWLLALRAYTSKDVVLQAVQLLALLLRHSPAALQAILSDTAARAAGPAFRVPEQPAESSTEPATILSAGGGAAGAGAAALLLFNLQLVTAVLPELPAASMAAVWQRSLPIAAASGPLAAGSRHQALPPQAQQLLLRLLSATGQRLVDSGQHGTVAHDSIATLAGLIDSESLPEPALLAALLWLEQAATWFTVPAAQAASEAAAVDGAGAPTWSDSFPSALSAALACADAQSPSVRAAALRAARALASSERGAALLVTDSGAAARLYQCALLHLSDLHAEAAAAAQQLLQAAAAPLVLAAASGPATPSTGSSDGSASAVAQAAAEAALGPQRSGFRPAQLQQLLSLLCGPKAPAAVLTGSDQQQVAPLRQLLPRLLHSMQAVPAPAEGAARSLEARPWRTPTCLSLAAWCAVQEAAKQCVAARLRTHHGGPAQTLAALEQALQAAVGRLQLEQQPASAVLEHPQGGSTSGDTAAPLQQQQLQAVVLLLLFLYALEQGIASASDGCTCRTAAPQTSAAFFAANGKVCRAWFARLRPTLVRAAAAAQLHELAAFHALQRLEDLRQQAQVLMPAAAAAGGTLASSVAGSPAIAAVTAAAPEGSNRSGTSSLAEAPAAMPGQPWLTERRASGIAAAAEGTAGAANPAAALLAATRGSPDSALLGQQSKEPASPAAAAQRNRTTRQRAQQLAAKVAEAAAAAASALCALEDADGVAGLQDFCRLSFQPLLQLLYVQQAEITTASATAATDSTSPASADEAAAAAAAFAAWDWLSAAGQQAAGRYEAAIKQYGQLYAPSACRQCAPAGALARLAAESYMAVGDADGLATWLQTQPGSRLPPAAAQQALRLASWEGATAGPSLQQAGGAASTVRELMGQLEVAGLDPAARSAAGGSATLPAKAALLAQLAAASGQAGWAAALPQLPAQTLLSGVAAGAVGRPEQPLSAWQAAEGWGPPTAAAVAAAAGAASLHPLLLLLHSPGVHEGPRALLLLRAAQAAAAGGNIACARHLQLQAGRAISAGGVEGQEEPLAVAARLLLATQELQACPAGRDASLQAWQLLRAAIPAGEAPCVVPAAACALLADLEPHAGILPAEARDLTAGADVRLGSSVAPMRPLEQLLVWPAAAQQGVEAAHALHYAALKTAVASVPCSANQWWQWAAWLHRLVEKQEEQQHQQQGQGQAVRQAAWAAAFAASCQALVHGASSSSGDAAGGFGALPVLLQVLQTLGQHGSSGYLPSDAGERLAAVPAVAWLPVMPQLISCLAGGSGSSGSRELLLNLLLHIGSTAPCQVLLPALVASAQAAAPCTPSAAPAGSPLALLVQHLQGKHPVLAGQLRVLVAEAARLAVLPEEHWQAVLQEAAATAAKRLQAQQRAARRLAKAEAATGPGGDACNAGTAGDAPAASGLEDGGSYWAALGPVLLPLQQQLEAAERASPQTPHERRFHQQWLPRLRQLLQQLAAPLPSAQGVAAAGAGPAAPSAEQQQRLRQRPVALLRAAASELAGALHAKQLALADVAPALAELADTGIPIPGAAPAACADAGCAAGGAPTLARVAGEVAVLSTKTRPKRLRLTASDGSRHSFLLKGREDLRAEARLMQLLRACHAALQHPGAARDGALAVHCFEVTPLGARLGLVQWVEDTVPLYELFTAWQQGQAQRQRLLASAPAGGGSLRHAPTQQQQPLRPVELFYAKLREVGIDPAAPRDTWPADRLGRAFAGMEKTVERKLLWTELWAGSSGAADWWQRQRAFVASAAAMSMVGHLLGLGDRHLDNILLHRRGAHLVHIDFSVVFDRGLHLKVPEVVPFRLTQTLAEALGVTGMEGGFRMGCERTLRTLRANAAPLCALLEASLLDLGVDWEAEGAAKAASRAFAQALALHTFALRAESAAVPLAAAARGARAALGAAAGTLGPYLQQFLAAASAATAAGESHALLQRCEATLGSAAAQEQQLAAQAEEGRASVEGMLAAAQPLAAQLQACLRECQAWQQRHNALLPLLVVSPPAALLAGPAAIDAAAAAAAGMQPLLLVTGHMDSGAPLAEAGAGSIVHVALGAQPSHAPLSASLLLQAAAADQQGQRLLQERAAAARKVSEALQQYAAAAACLLGGVGYAGSSQHAHWLAAFQAAMDLPIPEGFERATELAPKRRDPAEAAAAWRPLAAAAAAAVGLAEQLGSTSAALQLERVDVALAAADAKQRAVDAAESAWSGALGAATAASREQAAAALARAFAAFSEQQAADVLQLTAEHEEQAEFAQQAGQGDAEEAAVEAAPPAVLEGVQRLILGYASTAVAVRDATSEELFLAPDGDNLLGWLSQAVQAADSLSTAAAEMQLLLPPLMALLHSPSPARQVAAAVAATAEQLDAADGAGELAGMAAAEERAAAAAMQPLLMAAGQHPVVAALLQSVQSVQAAARLLLPPEDQPSLARQQLLLAGVLVGLWQQLEEAAATSASDADEGPAGKHAAAASPPWQQCSAALAAAAAEEVAQHLLPTLADALGATGQRLRAAATSLAQRAGLQASSPAAELAGEDPGGPPDLVPFTDFDAELPGAGALLGSLEEELEMGSGSGGEPDSVALAELAARQPGGTPPSHPGLVPFLDFDDGLAGAEDLLEPLDGGPGSFEGVPGSSQEAFYQPAGDQGQPLGDEGARAQPGGCGAAQAVTRHLPTLLAAAAEACGALAAVDAVRYVGALAAQQCQQLRQRHCGGLAAFQWLNEHLLPGDAADAAASLLAAPGTELSGATLTAAGAAMPPMHPAVATWVLRSSRADLLHTLAAGAGTLQALQAPLQQWQQQLAAVAAQLAAEVDAAAPYASSAVQRQLQHQQQWLQQAAGVAASLVEVAQAVLQLEAARNADVPPPPADATQQQPGQPEPAQGASGVDRHQAEQWECWQRYEALLRQMQQLQDAYGAAQGGVQAAEAELEQLRLRRREADAIKQSAEVAGSAAAASFAALALPLVKATQQLPPAVARLLPELAGACECAAQLAAARHAAAELAAAECGEDSGAAALAAEARQAAGQLAGSAACLRDVKAATEALQAALLPARNRLLAGRRGEAAAQAQAAEVVDALSAAVTQLHSQLDHVPAVQGWLEALPSEVQGLASEAKQRASALQRQHGFTLRGLERLLQAADPSVSLAGHAEAEAARAPAVPACGTTLTGSLLATTPAVPAGDDSGLPPRRAYANAVLARVRAKLSVQTQGDSSHDGSDKQAAADVAAEVKRLISAATSRTNLARMYEGWMPWV